MKPIRTLPVMALLLVSVLLTACGSNRPVAYNNSTIDDRSSERHSSYNAVSGTYSDYSHYSGLETPSYRVTQSEDNIEFRRYDPMILAEVEVSGLTRQDAAMKGYRTLSAYIDGKNIGNEKIAMTSPVLQVPLRSSAKMWKVQFVMPSDYAFSDLPKPIDQRIRFVRTEPMTVAAVTFSGDWGDTNLRTNKASLEQYLRSEGVTTVGSATYAYYDAPMSDPTDRRNEILYKVRPDTSRDYMY